MDIFFKILDFILGLIAKLRGNADNMAGRAEQKSETLSAEVVELKRQAQAQADAPVTTNDLVEKLKRGEG